MSLEEKLIFTNECFLGNTSSPQFSDHYSTSTTDLGPVDLSWSTEFTQTHFDVSGLEKTGNNTLLCISDNEQTSANGTLCADVPKTSSSLDESSFSLGQIPVQQACDLSTTVESPTIILQDEKEDRKETLRTSSFGLQTTPRRLCFSLGAEPGTHLNWSISMQTPYAHPCSAPPLVKDSESFQSIGNESEILNEIIPESPALSPCPDSKLPNEQCEHKLQAVESSNVKNTLSFLFSTQPSQVPSHEKLDTEKENFEPSEKEYNFSQKTIQVLNIFSPCSNHRSLDACVNSDCDVSFTDHFSNQILPSVMNNASNGVDSLSSIKFDIDFNESFNETIVKTNSGFTTSTPARKLTVKQNLCDGVSPLPLNLKNQQTPVNIKESEDNTFICTDSKDSKKQKFAVVKSGETHSGSRGTLSSKRKKFKPDLQQPENSTTDLSTLTDSRTIEISDPLKSIVTNETISPALAKGSLVYGATDKHFKRTIFDVESWSRNSESKRKKTNETNPSPFLRKISPESSLLGPGLRRKGHSTAKGFLYPTNSQIMSLTDISNSSDIPPDHTKTEVISAGGTKITGNCESVKICAPPEKSTKAGSKSVSLNLPDLTPSQAVEVEAAKMAIVNLQNESWFQLDSNSPDPAQVNKKCTKTPVVSHKRSVPKRLFERVQQLDLQEESLFENEAEHLPSTLTKDEKEKAKSNNNEIIVSVSDKRELESSNLKSARDESPCTLTNIPEMTAAVTGFKMASGKDMKLSVKALEHAKAMFHEEVEDKSDEPNFVNENGIQKPAMNSSCKTLTNAKAPVKKLENFKSCSPDEKLNELSNSGKEELNNSCPHKKETQRNRDDTGKALSNRNSMPQFRTASGKGLLCSEEALKATTSIFDSENLPVPGIKVTPNIDSQNKHGEFVKSNSNVTCKSVTSNKIVQCVQKNSFISNNTLSEATKDIGSYNRTMSDKNFKSKKFVEIPRVSGFDSTSDHSAPKCALKETRKPLKVSLINDEPVARHQQMCGFKTVPGKAALIPESALKLGTGLTVLEKTAVVAEPSAFCGFKSASGKDAFVSESALKSARKLLQDDTINEKAVAYEKSSNFCTGKPASITESALNAARNLFLQDDTVNLRSSDCEGSPPSGSTKTKSPVSALDSSLHGVRGVLKGNVNSSCSSGRFIEKQENLKQPFANESDLLSKDFCVSPRKLVLTSGEDLKASKVINPHGKQSPFGLKTAYDKLVPINEFAIKKTRPALIVESGKSYKSRDSCIDDQTNCDKPSFVGFKTACGKDVSINDFALEKAKALFTDSSDPTGDQSDRDRDDVKCKSTNVCDKQSFVGFKTACGNAVSINTSALEKARALFEEPSCTDKANDNLKDSKNKPTSNCDKQGFEGFKTACGNAVSIHASALEKARSLFEDSSCTDKAKDNLKGTKNKPTSNFDFEGFKTACGNAVSINASALEKARSLFEETSCTDNANNNLKESKNKPTSNCDKQSFEGFKTAYGKTVSVAESTLKKVKAIFGEDSDFDNPQSNAEAGASTHHNFPVFQTAGGKNMSVSKSALEAAKSLFCDNTNDVENSAATIFNEPSLIQNFKPDRIVDSEELAHFSKSTSKQVDNLLPDKLLPYKKPAVASNSGISTFDGNRRPTMPSNKSLKLETSSMLSDKSDNSLPGITKDTEIPNQLPTVKQNGTRFESTVNPTLCHSELKQSSLDDQKEAAPFTQVFPETQDWLDEEYLAYTELVENQELAILEKMKQNVGVLPGKIWEQRATKCNRLPFKVAVAGERPCYYDEDQLLKLGVRKPTIDVRASNAEYFCFTQEYILNWPSDPSGVLNVGDGAILISPPDHIVGKEEISRAFLSSPGVDPNLVDKIWIFNHFRWIVWKLAALEVAFPNKFAGSALTPDEVMLQLKYRYDREIDKSERSSLKKIIERDETSSKTLILCVCSVNIEPRDSDDDRERKAVPTLEFTDGWYKIKGSLDPALCQLVEKGKINVGDKIITSGAELTGSDTACPPLEMPESLSLRISANSTRLAKWDTRLGFHSRPKPFPIPISSILPDGGIIGCLKAVVYRVFPIQYLERYPDGSTVTRSSFAENKAMATYEKMRSAILDKIIAKAQEIFENKEMLQEKRQQSVRRNLKIKDLSTVSCGQQLFELMETATDIKEFQSSLSHHQLQALKNHQQKIQCSKQASLQDHIKKAIEEKELSNEMPKERNVIPVLKIRLCCLLAKPGDKHNTAILSIWNPSQGVQELLGEGKEFGFYNILPRARKGHAGDTQLSSTKRTSYEKLELKSNIRDLFSARKVLSLQDLKGWEPHCSPDKEIETVGLVFKVQTNPLVLYLTDSHLSVADLHFKFSYENICLEDSLKVGQFICVSHVHLTSKQPMCSLYTTEFSVITTDPRKDYLKNALQMLKQTITDVDNVMQLANDVCRKITGSSSHPTTPTMTWPSTTKVTPYVRRHYPQYSPVFCSPVGLTRTTPKPISDGLIIKNVCKVEPGSPAESLRYKARQRMNSLEQSCLTSPVSELPSPPTVASRKPFKVPVKKDNPQK